MHCQKSILYHNGKIWIKKDQEENFSVGMGAFDGAEVCEVVGIFLLYKLSTTLNKRNIGIFRDDGLLIMEKGQTRALDQTKKLIDI